METLLRDHPSVATGRTITVGANDSGRMVSLRVGDRLAINVPSTPGAAWRLRGGAPMLTPTTPHWDEPSFVLLASRPGRTGLDLVASGEAQPLPRPLRLIVLVSA